MQRGFLAGAVLTVVLAVTGVVLLFQQKSAITDDNAHNILGIVEASLMKTYRNPVTQDSLHREFLAIHEKVRRGEADSAGLRRLVREFYSDYGDGRIDSSEAAVLTGTVKALAGQ